MSGDYLINEFLVQVCVCTYGREVQVIGHGQGHAPASSKYLTHKDARGTLCEALNALGGKGRLRTRSTHNS